MPLFFFILLIRTIYTNICVFPKEKKRVTYYQCHQFLSVDVCVCMCVSLCAYVYLPDLVGVLWVVDNIVWLWLIIMCEGVLDRNANIIAEVYLLSKDGYEFRVALSKHLVLYLTLSYVFGIGIHSLLFPPHTNSRQCISCSFTQVRSVHFHHIPYSACDISFRFR